MRKYLDIKNLDAKIVHARDTVAEVRDTVTEVRSAATRAGRAAESQATLNVALTAVCVAALLVALLAVREVAR